MVFSFAFPLELNGFFNPPPFDSAVDDKLHPVSGELLERDQVIGNAMHIQEIHQQFATRLQRFCKSTDNPQLGFRSFEVPQTREEIRGEIEGPFP